MESQKEKLLILGGSSLLAYLWVKQVNPEYKIYISKHKKSTNYMSLESIELDIFQNSVQKILKSYHIDIVLNCIGLTNIEVCETNL